MSAPPECLIIPDNIALLTGPPLIGIILNWCLYGILIVQYYLYCTRAEKDRSWIVALVHILFTLDTIQSILTMADAFHWFAFGFGRMDKLAEYYTANFGGPILLSIVVLISQGMFCWRIWCLSRWKVLCVFIALCSLTSSGAGLAIGVLSYGDKTVFRWNRRDDLCVIVWGAFSVVSDTLISGSLLYLMLKRHQTVHWKTKRVLMRFVTITIETNTLTTILATLALIFSVVPSFAPPHTAMFMTPTYMLGKLYSNTFMAILNNRDSPLSSTTAGDSVINSSTSQGKGIALLKRHYSPSTHAPSSAFVVASGAKSSYSTDDREIEP